VLPDGGGGGDDDAVLLAEFRKRAEQLRAKEHQQEALILENWKTGHARVGAIAALDDWVRRVALLGDDLFVGTSRSGVQRFRRGEPQPWQRLPVRGDASVGVPADHPALEDPETSVTSLDFDGRWLAAGLAGGGLHVWDADGAAVLEAGPPSGAAAPCPCYTALLPGRGALITASGRILQCWRLPACGEADGEAKATLELPSRVHCLAVTPEGGVVVGLEDGSTELRSADLSLASRHQAHQSAVSAVSALEGGGLVTGDALGQLARWRVSRGADGTGGWQAVWRAQHDGRVVAIREGGAGTLVTGALDGTVRAWWAESGAQHFVVPGHKVWLGSICIREDTGIMVTDGRDNAVYIYDFSSEG